MKRDFTQGSIPRQLFLFSLPILMTNLLQAAILLINGLWVGNLLGSEAFAAVTVGTTVVMVVLAFVLGMNNATLTIFAQLKGADDQQGINRYLSTFSLLLLILSLAIGICGYLFSPAMLALLNTPESIANPAKIYLQVNFAGTLFLVGYNFIGTVLRAFGDSKTPLYFVLIATLLTTVLAPIFIAGFQLGVAGAAYAIVVAQAVAFIYSLMYLAKRSVQSSFRFSVPKWVEIKTILALGIPSGIQMMVIYAGMAVILSLVNSFGEEVVAGFGAAQRLDSIVLLPGVALGAAVNAMAAQNIGAQNWARVAHIAKTGVIYNTVVMLAISAVLFIFARPLVTLFIQEPDSTEFGINYLRTIALFYPFIGLNFILNGIVRGAGAMFQVLALNIISLWLLRIPLSYWMTALFGESGVALGIGLSFMLSCLFSMAYYRWGNWRNKQLFT